MKLLIALSLFVAAAHSAELHCDYTVQTTPVSEYVCGGSIITSRTDYFVETLTGSHIQGKGNDDVSTITFTNTRMEVLPRNLNIWFRNYMAISIIGVENYPNFRRSDFYDFERLRRFYASRLPLVTRIERETFWDLTRLRELYLDQLTNMKDLDADLLKNARALQVFSARGPNRITQIPPGFFRNQEDSLLVVDFRDTKLVKIGYSVFVNLQRFELGRFENAGCLNKKYEMVPISTLTRDIRSQCQDVLIYQNDIMKKGVQRRKWTLASSSSSSSSESQ